MNWAGLGHPVELAALGWVLFVALVFQAGFVLLRPAARRDFLPLSIQQHAWLAGIVCLGVLWSLRIRIDDGLQLSMIGVSLYALVFGYRRALLGAAVALVGLTALTHGGWLEVGLTGLLLAALPAGVATALQRLLRMRLPLHLFVFIIGNGLFATLVASSCAQIALLAVQLALAQRELANAGEVAAYALLLAWGEALVSGMVFSALVVFRPQIVMTYAQDDYLRR